MVKHQATKISANKFRTCVVHCCAINFSLSAGWNYKKWVSTGRWTSTNLTPLKLKMNAQDISKSWLTHLRYPWCIDPCQMWEFFECPNFWSHFETWVSGCRKSKLPVWWWSSCTRKVCLESMGLQVNHHGFESFGECLKILHPQFLT